MVSSQKRSTVDTSYDRQELQQIVSVSDSVKGEVQAGKRNSASIAGSMIGSIVGCLLGMGIVAVPEFIPQLIVGTSETALIITLAGGGIGLASGGLISALAVSEEGRE